MSTKWHLGLTNLATAIYEVKCLYIYISSVHGLYDGVDI